MPEVLFFGPARDVAGVRQYHLTGGTVGDVLIRCIERCGPRMAELLASSQVWVNGEPAIRTDPVGEDDEMAIIPPVSGGA